MNNNFDYVDLGLPSGTLWAKCNVGASCETDYGLYFAWGETVGYPDASSEKEFTWEDYKWWDGSDDWNQIHAIKYNSTDGKTILDLEDDAAHVNMGGDWRMPTKEEFEELTGNTLVECVSINGVNGRKFSNMGDLSKYIFIPASGCCSHCSHKYVGSYCYVWMSSLGSPYRSGSWSLYFHSIGCGMYEYGRCVGQCVRAVLNKK